MLEPPGAGEPLPGGLVVPGPRGGCVVRLTRPLEPMAIVAVVAAVARYPLDDTLVVPCDVRALAPADSHAVDTLARLCLGLKRQGRTLRVEGASRPLRQLLTVCGLSAVIPCEDAPRG